MQITWSDKIDDDIRLRVGPLKQAWEARGPGLLQIVAGRIGEAELVARATVVPCPPNRGGGWADPLTESIHIEALLVNPVPQLPEVLRMGWLLSQLKPRGDSVSVATNQLALIPPLLEAGEDVELARYDRATVVLALTNWVDMESDVVEAQTGIIMDWWANVRNKDESWNEQITTLEEMLNSAEATCDSN